MFDKWYAVTELYKNIMYFHLQLFVWWKKVSFHPLIFYGFCPYILPWNCWNFFLALKSSHPFPITVLIELTYLSLCFFFFQEFAEITELYHATTRNLLWIQISKRDQHRDAVYWLWRTWYSSIASSKLAYICRSMLSPTKAEDLESK